ncbi:hypothetical protein ILFOPFJJ_05884 [Ensifer psoraleae]|nr:hypothetical protein [Sinorhizobium psoraleae]
MSARDKKRTASSGVALVDLRQDEQRHRQMLTLVTDLDCLLAGWCTSQYSSLETRAASGDWTPNIANDLT